MKSLFKVLAFSFIAILLFYTTLALSYKDPEPSCFHEKLPVEAIAIHELQAVNNKAGVFKSEVELQYQEWNCKRKNFSGLKVEVNDNPSVDAIFIGQTNNLNCRIELWKDEQMIAYEEKGFMAKIELPDPFTLSMEFFDQENQRQPNQASIRFKVFQGSDFTGDSGNLSFDLSQFGDFSGKKYVSSFSLVLEDRNPTEEVSFADLSIWKNHRSGD
ncbi:MAG: hypothetical protein RIC95_06775 [Vicingaceae bacterium]